MKNPWLEDAAKGATGETYEIRTIADFFKVPEARRYVCLREFHAFMTMQEGFVDLLCAAGDALEAPMLRSAIHMQTDVYRWHDDGKATVSIHLHPRASHGTPEQP
jgi:hypothetical protein